MTEPISPQELPRWVPGQILLASDEQGWSNVMLRSYRYAPSEVYVPPMRDFMLVAYGCGPTSMDRKVDGPWLHEFMVPGNVSLLTRAEESHWHWTSDIEVTHLYLTHDMLAKISAEIFDRDIDDVKLQDVLKINDPMLRAGIAALAQEVGSDSPGGRLYVDALTTQICIQILRRYAAVVFREHRLIGGLTPLQAKMVSEYIEINLDQQLTLDELAEIAHVSASHFLRQFKQRFGTAPHCYVIQRRVACAQRLLAKTSLAIKQISARSGFSDQSHMTRVFQKHLGTTPSAYREQSRK
jgi:AraC family transcriptional regulator